jgi:hypothetical protein
VYPGHSNRPQRRRCRFLQALCLIWFSFYLGFGLIG